MLKKQFPQYDGFQSVICVTYNKADKIIKEGIQLMNVNSNHWICAFIHDKRDTIDIYDSFYLSIDKEHINDFLKLIHTNEPSVTFRNMKMQLQKNNDDCGVFAIAVATSLCFGEDPTVVRWNVESMTMRTHLLQCIEKEEMEPFPQAQKDMSCQGKTNYEYVHTCS